MLSCIESEMANRAADLETRVQVKLCGQIRDLRIIFVDKGIVLQGRAPTYYAKQLAQHAVLESTRVPILANEIEVY